MQDSIRNLSDLTKEELKQIGELTKTKPTLVIVHPYYYSTANPGLNDLLTSEKRKGRLIIFLEEEIKVNELKERLQKLNASNNHSILIVPTLRHNPQPVLGWQKFFKQLDALKVKKIVVGGKEIQKTTLEDMLRRNPFAVTVLKIFSNGHRDYIKATKARLKAAELNAGRGYTFCAGTTWSMLKARGKQKVKIVQNQFTTARRK
jgi:hypothetical protein